jgi:hypothetical protein
MSRKLSLSSTQTELKLAPRPLVQRTRIPFRVHDLHATVPRVTFRVPHFQSAAGLSLSSASLIHVHTSGKQF